MPLNLAARPDENLAARPDKIGSPTRYQNWAFLFCVAFGLAVIANVQLANDGGWLWYAIFARSGRHLYSDMHLALQPLFCPRDRMVPGSIGQGWIATKVPAILHLIAYCFRTASTASLFNPQ